MLREPGSARAGSVSDRRTAVAFVVTGRNLLAYLPVECGVLLNPESDDSAVLPPSLVDEIKNLG
jgi:hypothetical protein